MWSEVKSFSCVRLFATPWTIAYQAPLSMGFSRQEYWSGLPFPSPGIFPTQGLNPGIPHCRQTQRSEPPGKTLPWECSLVFLDHASTPLSTPVCNSRGRPQPAQCCPLFWCWGCWAGGLVSAPPALLWAFPHPSFYRVRAGDKKGLEENGERHTGRERTGKWGHRKAWVTSATNNLRLL